MEPTTKRHGSRRKHKKGFFKRLLKSLGIGKRRHRKQVSKTIVNSEVDKPNKKKHPKRSQKRGSFYFIRRLFLKRRHHHKSRRGVTTGQQLDHQPTGTTTGGVDTPGLQRKASPKSKAKYKKAIRLRNQRERRKRLKFQWMKIWQNTFYFLNLRSHPYDPFSKHSANFYANKKLMTIRQFIVYIFNSTVLFLITYIIAFLTYQLTVIFVASFFGIDSVLYYYEVFFPIGNYNTLWTRFNIIMITLSGPLISLIAGGIYYKFFLPRDVFGPVTKLFFLWLTFHSFNMFFGAYIAGFITEQGFGYVINWLYLRFMIKLTLVMLSLFVMMVIGYYATKPLLETSNSYQRINQENRKYFILTQALVPWILGSLILILIKIPNRNPQHENIIVYDLIILATLVFAIVPTFFNKKAIPDSLRFKSKKRMKFVWLYMLVAILLIVAYRLGLADGLHFIIRIMFRVAPYGL